MKTPIARKKQMLQPISDPRVFYVTMKDSEGNELYETVNPLAHEIKVSMLDDGSAVLSWFDIANQSMRSEEIASYEHPDANKYEIKDVYETTYIFEFITKDLYEKYVHPICAGSPATFDTDDEVQRWLLKAPVLE
jgi:hypothetical protein